MRNSLRVVFVAAAMACGAGCRSVPPDSAYTSLPAAAVNTESVPTKEIGPIEAANRQLSAIARGDVEEIRSWEYCDVTNALPGLRAGDEVLAATARMRIAFDKEYGAGRLVKVCPMIASPGSHIPTDARVKIDGYRATITARGWEPRQMIRVNDVWRQDLTGLDWAKGIEKYRLEGEPLLPEERLVANLHAMAAILDRTTVEVEAGKYHSFAEAFGVLNARLHGRAAGRYPLYLGIGLDVTERQTAEDSTLRTSSSTVKIVQLRGDAAEMGRSHGEQLGEGMRSVLKQYFDKAFNLSTDGGRKLYGMALKVASGFEQYLRPEHREEIQALAASVGIEPGQAMLGQCFADLNPDRACSTVSFPAAASPDGVARLGRNLDYVTLGVLNRNSVLLVYHPKDHYAFAAISPAPGLIGVLSGMNEHGLCVAVMEVPRAFRFATAMPCMLLYRTVLENCRTVDEAVGLLRKTPRQSSNNLMIMDASGERVVAEITPDQVVVRRAKDDAALISTNHQRGNDFDSPGKCLRFDYLHDASQRQFGHITEEDVQEMLAGSAQGDFTFQSMVFEPANRVLYLALGTGAPGHRFERIDVKKYFERPHGT
jgi:hypothetical protein